MGKPHHGIDSGDPCGQMKLNRVFHELVANIDKPFDKMVVVCIGTDRNTGDCFGPLVGHFFSPFRRLYLFDVYGTIDKPVYALNLEDTLSSIDHSNTLVIALDAALEEAENIGHIKTSYDPIYPGSGVGKNLPPVGDIQMSGIVNLKGFMPAALPQCTRLSLVYRMARMALWAILHACSQSPLKEKVCIYIPKPRLSLPDF